MWFCLAVHLLQSQACPVQCESQVSEMWRVSLHQHPTPHQRRLPPHLLNPPHPLHTPMQTEVEAGRWSSIATSIKSHALSQWLSRQAQHILVLSLLQERCLRGGLWTPHFRLLRSAGLWLARLPRPLLQVCYCAYLTHEACAVFVFI